MTKLLTRHIASITELREPAKVLERAGGEPVAILKNSQPVAYLVPVERTLGEHRVASNEEVERYLVETQASAQPVLDYLRDK